MQNMTMGLIPINIRFYISLCLSLIVLVLHFVYPVGYVELILSSIILFVCGSIFFTNMWHDLRQGRLNMFALILLSMLSAYGYSCYHLVLKTGQGLYFTSIAYITTLVLWSHMIEMNAKMMMQMKTPKILDKMTAFQAKIDEIASYFVFFTIIIALVSFGVWSLYVSFSQSLSIFMAVLLGACPCALTLATPICFSILQMQKSVTQQNLSVAQLIINQNIEIGVIYNIIMIPLAGGILYPLTGYLITPVVATVCMSLSSVIIIYNSQRLKYLI